MHIVLLGAPGAGKDTLADKFNEQYHYINLTPGEIFRSEAARGTDLGLHARDTYWGNGILCPDDIVNGLVKEAFNNFSEKDACNVFFNGYPRSVNQAIYLNTLTQVDIALELRVDEDVAVERLLKRGREDDKEDIIRRRFKEFEEKTEPVMGYYQNLKGCAAISISADESPQMVFAEAFQMILECAPIEGI